jgi:hypothetical protein
MGGVVCALLASVAFLMSVADATAATAPTVTATPVLATEGEPFSGQVGSMSPCTQLDVSSDTVTITWGDGTTSSGALVPIARTCEVTGAHTYAEEGSYATQVSVDYAGGAAPATGSSTASVADAPISLTSAPGIGSGVVAKLQDAGGLEPAADYLVSINWGDAQVSPGAVDGAGDVTGSHSYASAGTYSVTVTVTDDGGQSANTTFTVTISLSPSPCAATTANPAAGFSPTATSPDARWVQAIYHDLLGRPPDATGLASLTAALADGASRDELVVALEGDPDRPVIVGSLYNAYLHRPPTAAELSFSEQLLASGGTDEQLGALLLGSSEYLMTRGGGTNPGFLGSLYCDVFHRSIDRTALNAWERELAGRITRQQVAQAVLSSTEYRGDLIEGLYLRFLRRMPSPTDRTAWLDALNGGVTDEQVIAALLSSQEYFNDFSGGAGTVVSSSVSALGVVRVTLKHPATLQLKVLELLPAVQRRAFTATKPTITAPRTRLVGTVSLGHHGKGRVTIHWNRKVDNHTLRRGRYVLLIEARAGRKLRDVSDAITVRLR